MLLSDVQRGANDLRKDIADSLPDRVHHDQLVHAQYGSVQRTSRRSKSLKDDTAVLAALEDAGIDRDRVLGVDPDKVDDELDVTDLHEQAVYDIDERAYIRKADVNGVEPGGGRQLIDLGQVTPAKVEGETTVTKQYFAEAPREDNQLLNPFGPAVADAGEVQGGVYENSFGPAEGIVVVPADQADAETAAPSS